MTTRTAQALQWLNSTTGATQQQAAALFGIKQPTISAALAARRKAARTAAQHATLVERDRCATLARAMGAHGVAAAILDNTDRG